MLQKLYKILLILGIVAVLVFIPAFWVTFSASSDLEVSFLDVGQGDSTLIKTPSGQNILIDGGADNKVIDRLSEELPWWDKQIDLMILTHPHDDHVGGLVDVIKRYNVKKIVYTGVVHTSPNYLAWLDLIKERKIPLVIIDRPQTIHFGDDCRLEILYPFDSLLGQSVSNTNNSSIVAKLIYNQVEFLFSGDAEVEIERELIEAEVNLQADVFQAGHHGSDTSNSQEFLDKISPQITVIQVGEDNDFGHPSRRVIKRLERKNSQIFRNDLNGTISIVSDGEKLYVY